MSEFHTVEEVIGVRHDLSSTWLETLEVLQKELATHKKSRSKSLPEAFVKKLKVCSDQLRIEYRIGHMASEDGDVEKEVANESSDPLHGLTVVSPEDAA